MASGMVGTGGPNDEDAEGAEEGNTVTEELFPGQRGAPEGAGALFVVLELTFAEDMAVARLAGMSDGTREGQLAVQAGRATLSLQMDVSVLTTTCGAEPERLVWSMTWLACGLAETLRLGASLLMSSSRRSKLAASRLPLS